MTSLLLIVIIWFTAVGYLLTYIIVWRVGDVAITYHCYIITSLMIITVIYYGYYIIGLANILRRLLITLSLLRHYIVKALLLFVTPLVGLSPRRRWEYVGRTGCVTRCHDMSGVGWLASPFHCFIVTITPLLRRRPRYATPFNATRRQSGRKVCHVIAIGHCSPLINITRRH